MSQIYFPQPIKNQAVSIPNTFFVEFDLLFLQHLFSILDKDPIVSNLNRERLCVILVFRIRNLIVRAGLPKGLNLFKAKRDLFEERSVFTLKKSYIAEPAQPAHLHLIAAQRSTFQFLLRFKIKYCATATKSAALYFLKV